MAAAAAHAETFGSLNESPTASNTITKPVTAGGSCQKPGCQLTLPQASVSKSSTSQLWLQDVKIKAQETPPEVTIYYLWSENLSLHTERLL